MSVLIYEVVVEPLCKEHLTVLKFYMIYTFYTAENRVLQLALAK